MDAQDGPPPVEQTCTALTRSTIYDTAQPWTVNQGGRPDLFRRRHPLLYRSRSKDRPASRLTHIIHGRAPEAKSGQFGYYQSVFLSSSSYSVRWDSVKFTNK